jgi:hypothetical protein
MFSSRCAKHHVRSAHRVRGRASVAGAFYSVMAGSPTGHDDVILRSYVTEAQVCHLRPTVHKRGLHDSSDTQTSVDTTYCLLLHPSRLSEVAGAFEQSISSRGHVRSTDTRPPFTRSIRLPIGGVHRKQACESNSSAGMDFASLAA